MKRTAIAIVVAASLAAATSIAADPPKASVKPDTPVAPDNVMGQSARSNVTSEEATPLSGTLSRSEKRALAQSKDAKSSKKKGLVPRMDLSGDKPTSPTAVTIGDTKNSVTGNPGAQ